MYTSTHTHTHTTTTTTQDHANKTVQENKASGDFVEVTINGRKRKVGMYVHVYLNMCLYMYKCV
jgi:hypothetical protein